VSAGYAAALAALAAAEQALSAARGLLAGGVAPPPAASEVYDADRLPPGAASWRAVCDAHRRGELRASKVGRKLVVTGEDWASYLASKKTSPRAPRLRSVKAPLDVTRFGVVRGGRG
jgi:hypothetical protein